MCIFRFVCFILREKRSRAYVYLYQTYSERTDIFFGGASGDFAGANRKQNIAQNAYVSLTLFAFDKGEEISTHDSAGDAMVTVLEGTGQFTVNGEVHQLKQGETLLMPAKIPHAVFAPEPFKMMLTVVFPAEKE